MGGMIAVSIPGDKNKCSHHEDTKSSTGFPASGLLNLRANRYELSSAQAESTIAACRGKHGWIKRWLSKGWRPIWTKPAGW
jgi:hypothetical protein